MSTSIEQEYRQAAELMVADYLQRIRRLEGTLSPAAISERFWEFNVLMQELEKALSEKAVDLMNSHQLGPAERAVLHTSLQRIAREACKQFNKKGKPGSG